MKLRRPATTLMITAALVASATTAASAAPAAHAKTVWKPYRTPPFLDHNVCSFDVKGVAVYDKEWVATLATYPDGSPKRQAYKGPLYIRYTNVSTGKSIVRNQSGKAWIDIKPDKTQVWRVLGYLGAGIKAGTKGYPAGEWLFHGDFVLTVAAGSFKVKRIHGTVTNLCHALG